MQSFSQFNSMQLLNNFNKFILISEFNSLIFLIKYFKQFILLQNLSKHFMNYFSFKSRSCEAIIMVTRRSPGKHTFHRSPPEPSEDMQRSGKSMRRTRQNKQRFRKDPKIHARRPEQAKIAQSPLGSVNISRSFFIGELLQTF